MIIRHAADCCCPLCRKADEIIAARGKRRARNGEPSIDYYVTDPSGTAHVWVPVIAD